MADFTLVELHLDDTKLSAKNPLGKSSGSKKGKLSVETSEKGSKSGGGSKLSWIAPIIGLVFLGVVAFLAKKKLGSSGSSGSGGSGGGSGGSKTVEKVTAKVTGSK